MSFTDAPTLRHDRVVLEQLTAAHAPDLAEASAFEDLWRTWYTSIPSPEGMLAEIERRLDLQAAGSMAPFAVIDPRTGRAVGMTTFMNIEVDDRRVEIGHTWLGRQAQRTGINTAAKLLLLTRAFEVLDCIAVEFRTHWHNRQSRQAIAELGASKMGCCATTGSALTASCAIPSCFRSLPTSGRPSDST